MTLEDTVQTLQLLDMLHKTPSNDYALCLNVPALDIYNDKIKSKGYLQVKEGSLKWDPILLHRMIAEREDENTHMDEETEIEDALADDA